MYATLTLKRLLMVLLWPFGAVIVGLIVLRGLPQAASEWVRLIGLSLSVFTILIIAIGGFSGRFALWRVLWKIVPALNDKFFPDLNGVWEGTTKSNWPVIESMMKAASSDEAVTSDTVESAGLRSDGITLTITASFFEFRVSGRLHSTGSKSHSLTERISREKRRNLWELYYVYRQETPEPQSTDEGSHLGAVQLDIDLKEWALEGSYWTRRKWRQGLNTAGIIAVVRQSR